ncbi:MAG: hypothetical protein IPH66_15475 [Crocinitomicaceae bacterium]|nr:hypothetical protein [Crocinitomicaceae bacterium]
MRFNGKFFVNDQYGKGIYFDENLNVVINDFFIHLFENDYVLLSKKENNERNTFILNISIKEINRIKSGSTVNLVHGKFLFRKNFDLNLIETYSFLNAQPLWQFSVADLGSYYDTFQREEKPYQVSKFLGICNNELLVAMQEHKILALDIASGKLNRSWNSIENLHFDDAVKDLIPRSSSFILTNNKLIGALHKFYFEIDLETGISKFSDLKAVLDKHGILSIYPVWDNPLDGDHFYLTAKMKDQDKGPEWSFDCLLALNIVSKEIDWMHSFDQAAIGVNRPRYANDKLYQLDNKHTLHIFQKV